LTGPCCTLQSLFRVHQVPKRFAAPVLIHLQA
jgi:hypothetical protein